MDLIPRQIMIVVFAQGALVLLWLFASAWRRRRAKKVASESATEGVPLTSQPWVWVAGSMVFLAATLLFLRPCTTRYWSRYPPTVEHRSELIDTATKLLSCPAEQIAINPFGDTGAEVTGCNRKLQVCWGRVLRHRNLIAWVPCVLP